MDAEDKACEERVRVKHCCHKPGSTRSQEVDRQGRVPPDPPNLWREHSRADIFIWDSWCPEL